MDKFDKAVNIIEKYKEVFSDGDYVELYGILKYFYDKENEELSSICSEETEESWEEDNIEDSDEEEDIEEEEESPEIRYYEWLEESFCNCSGYKFCKKLEDCSNIEGIKEKFPIINFVLTEEKVNIAYELKDEIKEQSKMIEIVGAILHIIENILGREKKIRLTFLLFDVILKSKSLITSYFKETILKKIKEFDKDKNTYQRYSEKLGFEENVLDIWEREMNKLEF